MAKIADFVGLIREDGLAKTSHFVVELNLPSALNTSPYVEKRSKIIAFCDQAQLPGISFSSSQVRSYGEFREVPYEKLFEPINLSFYVDNGMVIKNLFDDWLALIQDSTTRDFNYPNNYVSDKIRVIVENSESQQRYVVELNYCFIKAVSPIQLDYAGKDVMKVNVSLSYKYATHQRLGSFETAGAEGGPLAENDFTYGYDLENTIPDNYFTDFAAFQNDYSQYDFTFDGSRTALNGVDDMRDVLG